MRNPESQNQPAQKNRNEALKYGRAQVENFWDFSEAKEAGERVQHVLDFFANNHGNTRTRNSSTSKGDENDRHFERDGIREVQLVSVDRSTGSANFTLVAAPHLCSRLFKTLQGGAAATLLDILTSACLSIIARPGYLDAGHVTRTLTMTYLRPVAQGERVQVRCRIVDAGKNFASLAGEILTEDGKTCVTCVHDKAILQRQGSKL